MSEQMRRRELLRRAVALSTAIGAAGVLSHLPADAKDAPQDTVVALPLATFAASLDGDETGAWVPLGVGYAWIDWRQSRITHLGQFNGDSFAMERVTGDDGSDNAKVIVRVATE